MQSAKLQIPPLQKFNSSKSQPKKKKLLEETFLDTIDTHSLLRYRTN